MSSGKRDFSLFPGGGHFAPAPSSWGHTASGLLGRQSLVALGQFSQLKTRTWVKIRWSLTLGYQPIHGGPGAPRCLWRNILNQEKPFSGGDARSLTNKIGFGLAAGSGGVFPTTHQGQPPFLLGDKDPPHTPTLSNPNPNPRVNSASPEPSSALAQEKLP